MAKLKTRYVCSNCGATHLKWMGRCPACDEWDTLEEEVVDTAPASRSPMPVLDGGARPIALPDIPAAGTERLPLSNQELSRVLGGGIVPGAGVLVGGDPGIGKSTLLLQMAAEIARTVGPALYVSAEESAHQIKRRAARLDIHEANLFVLSETSLERIVAHAEAMKPSLIIVDSIQAIYGDGSSSAAGSVSQVRDCAALLLRLAKDFGTDTERGTVIDLNLTQQDLAKMIGATRETVSHCLARLLEYGAVKRRRAPITVSRETLQQFLDEASE